MIIDTRFDDGARQTYVDIMHDFVDSIPLDRLVGKIGIRGTAICSDPKTIAEMIDPEKIDIITSDLDEVRATLERMQPIAHTIGLNIGGLELGGYERPVVRVYGEESRTPIRGLFGKGSFQHTLSVQRSYYGADLISRKQIGPLEESDGIRLVYFVSSPKSKLAKAHAS
ncbi:MAG: hypothetical protein AABX53_00090 [Nanoarchaeota archaeon]